MTASPECDDVIEIDINSTIVDSIGSPTGMSGIDSNKVDRVEALDPKKLVPEMSPYDYQMFLFEKALENNTIVMLGTGSGKTLVSVMLIAWFSKRHTDIVAEYNRKMKAGDTEGLKKPMRKSRVFLSQTVALAHQQCRVICDAAQQKAELFVGSGDGSESNIRTWRSKWERADIHVMTHQVLLNGLRHGFVKLAEIDLLVFDECHHARKAHPYSLIMREFYDHCPLDERPHIFGMTASPLNANEVPEISVPTLQATFDSNLCTIDLSQVSVSGSKPKEICHEYKLAPEYEPTELTLNLIEECGECLIFQRPFVDSIYILNTLGPFAVDQMWHHIIHKIHITIRFKGSLQFIIPPKKKLIKETMVYVGNSENGNGDFGGSENIDCTRGSVLNNYITKCRILRNIGVSNADPNNVIILGDDDDDDDDSIISVQIPSDTINEMSTTLQSLAIGSLMDSGRLSSTQKELIEKSNETSSKQVNDSENPQSTIITGHHPRLSKELETGIQSYLPSQISSEANQDHGNELLIDQSSSDSKSEALAKIKEKTQEATKSLAALRHELMMLKKAIDIDQKFGGRALEFSELLQQLGGGKVSNPSDNLPHLGEHLARHDWADIRNQLSPQVNQLLEILYEWKERGDQMRGIVFVQRRMTAVLLVLIISKINEFRFIRSDVLLGMAQKGNGYASRPIREGHVKTTSQAALSDFSIGRLNLLIATQVAEEGIDIQPCNLIIRFVMPSTVTSFIQSRGRARSNDSQFVIMVPVVSESELDTSALYGNLGELDDDDDDPDYVDNTDDDDGYDSERYYDSDNEGMEEMEVIRNILKRKKKEICGEEDSSYNSTDDNEGACSDKDEPIDARKRKLAKFKRCRIEPQRTKTDYLKLVEMERRLGEWCRGASKENVEPNGVVNVSCEQLNYEWLLRKFSFKPQDEGEKDPEELGWKEELTSKGFVYTIKSTQAKITYGSANSIINRYIQMLPQDAFCMLSVVYSYEVTDKDLNRTDENKIHTNKKGKPLKPNLIPIFRAKVTLPSNAAIRQVVGPAKTSKKLAKQAASYRVAKKLHQLGAINDHLIPFTLAESQEERWNEKERLLMILAENTKSGTRSSKNVYDIWTPEVFMRTPPPNDALNEEEDGEVEGIEGKGELKESGEINDEGSNDSKEEGEINEDDDEKNDEKLDIDSEETATPTADVNSPSVQSRPPIQAAVLPNDPPPDEESEWHKHRVSLKVPAASQATTFLFLTPKKLPDNLSVPLYVNRKEGPDSSIPTDFGVTYVGKCILTTRGINRLAMFTTRLVMRSIHAGYCWDASKIGILFAPVTSDGTDIDFEATQRFDDRTPLYLCNMDPSEWVGMIILDGLDSGKLKQVVDVCSDVDSNSDLVEYHAKYLGVELPSKPQSNEVGPIDMDSNGVSTSSESINVDISTTDMTEPALYSESICTTTPSSNGDLDNINTEKIGDTNSTTNNSVYTTEKTPDTEALPESMPRHIGRRDVRTIQELACLRRLEHILPEDEARGQPVLRLKPLNFVFNYITKPIFNSDAKATEDYGFELFPFGLYSSPVTCSLSILTLDEAMNIALIPSFFTRLNQLLLVLEAKETMGLPTNDVLLRHALTSTNALIAGEDYQRLETLGDAVLKYIVTVYLYVTRPNDHEGILTSRRERLVSNAHLFWLVMKLKAYRYIYTSVLSRREWHLPGKGWGRYYNIPRRWICFLPQTAKEIKTNREREQEQQPKDQSASVSSQTALIEPNSSSEPLKPQPQIRYIPPLRNIPTTKNLSEKTIADIAESILGASMIDGWFDQALVVANKLGVLSEEWSNWDSMREAYTTEKQSRKDCVAFWKDQCIKQFEKLTLEESGDADSKRKDDNEDHELNLDSRDVLYGGLGLEMEEELRPLQGPTELGSWVSEIEEVIGYKFSDPMILLEALTHSSSIDLVSGSYQRLEFLGDALLDYMITRRYYDYDPPLTPYRLTLVKHIAVSNDLLSLVIVCHGLHRFLRHSSGILKLTIDDYLKRIKRACEYWAESNGSNYAQDNEDLSVESMDDTDDQMLEEGYDPNTARSSEKCNGKVPGSWVDGDRPLDILDIYKELPPECWSLVQAPKVLGDLFESLLGAVFIDSSLSHEAADGFYQKVLVPFLDNYFDSGKITLNQIIQTQLQCQAWGCSNFSWNLRQSEDLTDFLGIFIGEFKVHGTVLVSARGMTPRQAKYAAANEFLRLSGVTSPNAIDGDLVIKKSDVRSKDVETPLDKMLKPLCTCYEDRKAEREKRRAEDAREATQAAELEYEQELMAENKAGNIQV